MWFTATTADLGPSFGGVGTLTSSSKLGDNDLMNQRDVDRNVKDFSGQFNLAGRFSFGGHYVYGTHCWASFTAV
jgi:hypothetical protein